MTKKRSYNKPIMFPQANDRMYELRCEIAKRMGFTSVCDESWWDLLTPIQQSEINGMVTKMMIEKAKTDMMQGTFQH